MTNKIWDWAHLNSDQLQLVKDAEQSLDVDYLLAFKAVEPRGDSDSLSSPEDVQFAHLTESQLEVLQSLEASLEATLVAYQN